MSDFEKIIGYEEVIKVYGAWPTFYDAEIIKIQFDRRHIVEAPGPSILLEIKLHETSSDKIPENYLISFEFDNANEIIFDGFNYQNAIEAFSIKEELTIDNQKKFNIHFESAFGVDLKFKCSMAIVTINVDPSSKAK